MKFVWNDTYLVGVGVFDEQHKHFFDLVNVCYDMISAEDFSRDKLEAAVNDMANYALYHLSAEEDAFIKYSYPFTSLHVKAHDGYRQKIKELFARSRVANDENLVAITTEVVDFASNWLLEHILSIDAQYSGFFKGKL
jgi:hemerythrin-like metal-binding protein